MEVEKELKESYISRPHMSSSPKQLIWKAESLEGYRARLVMEGVQASRGMAANLEIFLCSREQDPGCHRPIALMSRLHSSI